MSDQLSTVYRITTRGACVAKGKRGPGKPRRDETGAAPGFRVRHVALTKSLRAISLNVATRDAKQRSSFRVCERPQFEEPTTIPFEPPTECQ